MMSSSSSHNYLCNTQVNVSYTNIIIRTPPALPAPEKANYHTIIGIFGIAVSALLTALQLKYQATTDSPFEDHPKAMAIAVASLLILCLGCDIQQYFESTTTTRRFATLFIQHGLRLTGYISLASLASVIFSTSTTSTPSLIVIFISFFSARFALQYWLQSKRNLHGNRGAYNHTLPMYHVASANYLV